MLLYCFCTRYGNAWFNLPLPPALFVLTSLWVFAGLHPIFAYQLPTSGNFPLTTKIKLSLKMHYILWWFGSRYLPEGTICLRGFVTTMCIVLNNQKMGWFVVLPNDKKIIVPICCWYRS